jgi:DNA mismatch endonuclease (patch repair protein)
VFVDGCFWHHCPAHFRPSRKNSDYWAAKIARNVARDRLNDRLLRESGWTVVRIWEHEPASEAADKIAELLRTGLS